MADSTTGSALFYVNPQPLSLAEHRNWRLIDGNVAYAKDALGIPLVIGEFTDASRFYPILFASGTDGGPIVLTGIDGENVFVTEGIWDPQTYIPAYLRRHPFILIGVSQTDPQDFALGIDVDSGRFAKEGTAGVALFDGDQPSQLTKDAMNFCSAYTGEAEVTRQFIAALRAKEILVDRRLDFTLPGDKKFAVDGFQIIDTQKLTDLDSETIAEWHRKGWLAACYAHLQSLNRVNDMLDRRARRTATTPTA
jgi:hypothetical protein